MDTRLAAVCFLALVASAMAGDEDVLDLSENSLEAFRSEISRHDTMLIEFFAPWCGHCKRLAPEYEKAAGSLKANDPPVPLAKVDCTNEAGGKDICNEFGVSGYPTLKIFKGGEFSQEYSGPREGDGIVKYMRAQVGPASKAYDTYAAVDKKLKESKDVLVVGLLASESDDLAKKFNKVADKLRETVNFAHVYASAASDDVSAIVSLSSVSAPAIVLVRPAAMKNKFEPSHVVYDESKPLDEWVSSNYHGKVGHRTQNNMDDFKPPVVVAFFDVDYVKNPKGTNYWRNRILKVAQNFDQTKFAISSGQSFAGELEEYGLEAPRDARDAAPLVAGRDKDGKKYIMKEKFTLDAFESWVKDFVEGKLEAHVKSEELPEDNSGPVKTAVGKNFDELVTNSEKDILIEFYAPWCGHCKKLAPIWEELGTALKDEPSIDIVKLDATANDVPAPFVVQGFPTIFYYPADTKTPKKYEGGREVDDFVKYLAKFSSKELDGYSRDGTKKAAKTEL